MRWARCLPGVGDQAVTRLALKAGPVDRRRKDVARVKTWLAALASRPHPRRTHVRVGRIGT